MYRLRHIIITAKAFGAPVQGKDVVGVMNARYKWFLKLAMTKLLNPEIIRDNPISQVHVGSWKWIRSSFKLSKKR